MLAIDLKSSISYLTAPGSSYTYFFLRFIIFAENNLRHWEQVRFLPLRLFAGKPRSSRCKGTFTLHLSTAFLFSFVCWIIINFVFFTLLISENVSTNIVLKKTIEGYKKFIMVDGMICIETDESDNLLKEIYILIHIFFFGLLKFN